MCLHFAKLNLRSCQTSTTEHFTKSINAKKGFKPKQQEGIILTP